VPGETPGLHRHSLLTLAIAVGANTAIFTVVSGVLLKPLPYSDAESHRPRAREAARRRSQRDFNPQLPGLESRRYVKGA
jgi:hypothetical protein